MDTRLKVMIVDDDEMSQMLISSILGDSYIIHSASNGSSCLQQLPELLPDVVLLDMQMPDVDGFEATKLIKQIRPDLPVIVQTAFVLSHDKNQAFEAGYDDYFVKPIDRNSFLEAINNHLSKVKITAEK